MKFVYHKQDDSLLDYSVKKQAEYGPSRLRL